MFIVPLDEEGFEDDSKCGWLCLKPEPHLVFSLNEAMRFIEKESGHGSFEDWKKFFEDEHPEWHIRPTPHYFD